MCVSCPGRCGAGGVGAVLQAVMQGPRPLHATRSAVPRSLGALPWAGGARTEGKSGVDWAGLAWRWRTTFPAHPVEWGSVA